MFFCFIPTCWETEEYTGNIYFSVGNWTESLLMLTSSRPYHIGSFEIARSWQDHLAKICAVEAATASHKSTTYCSAYYMLFVIVCFLCYYSQVWRHLV